MKIQIILSILIVIFGRADLASQEIGGDTARWQVAHGVYATFGSFHRNVPDSEGEYKILSLKEIEDYLRSGKPSDHYLGAGQYIWVGRFDENGHFLRVDPDSIRVFSNDRGAFVKHGDHLIMMDVVGAICRFNTSDAVNGSSGAGKDYLVKPEEGKVMKSTLQNFLGLISDDLELYQEFLQKGSYREMRESITEFLFRYNARHPLFSDK